MLRYILITPAWNEEAFIGKTIDSMLSQTVLPVRWVIVNDGSTDRTPETVKEMTAHLDWVDLVDMPSHRERSFAAKAHCFNEGYRRVRKLDFEVIGNLDADLSFEPDYIEFLLDKFSTMPRLGVAGTPFREKDYSSIDDSFEGSTHVAGGCQLFRRTCFEEIGGYVPNRAGGVDWIAVTTARMLGWQTRSFSEKTFFHHRSLGTAGRNRLAALFSYGEKDYYLGNHPLWQLLRIPYRMTKRPYLVGGLAVLSGYLTAAARRLPRPVSDDLMRFHREEQLRKLRAILSSSLRLRRFEKFSPSEESHKEGFVRE